MQQAGSECNLSAAGVLLVPEEELQKAAAAVYGVMHDTKSDHAATAAMALGHAGLRVPLPLPSSSTAPAGTTSLTEGQQQLFWLLEKPRQV